MAPGSTSFHFNLMDGVNLYMAAITKIRIKVSMPPLSKFHIYDIEFPIGNKFEIYFPITLPKTRKISVNRIIKASAIVLINEIITFFIKDLLSTMLLALFTPFITALNPDDEVHTVAKIEIPSIPLLWDVVTSIIILSIVSKTFSGKTVFNKFTTSLEFMWLTPINDITNIKKGKIDNTIWNASCDASAKISSS